MCIFIINGIIQLLCQFGHVAHQDLASVEVDQVGLPQFIEYQRNRLPTGTGDVGDILVGQRVLEQHLVADATPALLYGVLDELDDARAGILEDQRFELAFGLHQPGAELRHHAVAKAVIGPHQPLEVLYL